jgi:hypothetical protein
MQDYSIIVGRGQDLLSIRSWGVFDVDIVRILAADPNLLPYFITDVEETDARYKSEVG